MNTQLREHLAAEAAPPAERLVELSRGDRLAICECRYDGAEWDVRLVVHGDLWYRERCATWKQVVDTADRWRVTLSAKGWSARS